MDRRPGPDAGAARVSFGLVAAVLLHVMMIGGGFLWGLLQKTPEAQPEPIAVELVEEPQQPDPQPQPEQEKPSEPQQEASRDEPSPPQEKAELPPAVPLDLAPAFDAPKSASNDQELSIGDKGPGEMAVVAAPEPPQPPTPEKPPLEPPKPDPLPEPAKSEPVKSEAAPAPQETVQDAPPVEPLPPDPEGVPALAQPTPETKPETDKAGADKPEPPDPKRFAFFAPVPKMEFESGPKESRAPAGNALDSYTTRLYGMIVPLVRPPSGLPPVSRRRPVQVEFVVDGRGRLAGAVVTRSSGVPALDIAVLYALRQAAPYPPTPHGKPLPLVLDYEPP